MGTISRPAVPSYSLGDWLVIGVGAEENAADQIKHYQQFSVNIPDENFMLEMEQAGFISHREKLEHLGLDYEISERTQAPILEACPVVLDCQGRSDYRGRWHLSYFCQDSRATG